MTVRPRTAQLMHRAPRAGGRWMGTCTANERARRLVTVMPMAGRRTSPQNGAGEVRRERAMTGASDSLGLPPVAPMSLPARLRAVREFHTGPAVVRDVAGPVVRVPLGPRLVVPPFVLVTSPQGAHDVLAGSSNDTMDKLTQVHR